MKFVKDFRNKLLDKIVLIYPEDMQPKIRKFFNWYDKVNDNFIKPTLLGITSFWVFTRVKTRVGEDIYFVLLVIIILLLRQINKTLREILG